ncbi:MAG: glycosyltransferase family 2 protein [Candidatus Omnitrophica bacterium]|nr:glycosyltransferase family 2 protein [Candidatus Omnitrophota bacterium]
MKLSMIIICYNEKSTILKAIEEAMSLNVAKEIIVIDNCSNDGTQEILKSIKDKTIKIVVNKKNFGVGYSLQESIKLAQGDYYYSPCADLEYRMADVYKMIDKLEKEDLDAVFGSRLMERKNVSRWKLIKERPYWLGSIIATFLVNLLYKRKFTDIIATKLIKTSILKDIDFESYNPAFEFELVSNLCKRRYKIGEVPVWYKPRTHKEGKTIKATDMIPAIMAILKVKFSK